MRPYPQMKTTNIPWLPKLPKHWEIVRIKRHFKIIGGNGFNPFFQGNKSGDYPFYKASDISISSKKDKYICKSENYVTKEIAEENKYNIIPKDAILFAKIGEAMKKNNRVISTVNCCVDNNCQALIPKNINTEYSYYAFKCIDMNVFNNGGTIPYIDNVRMLNHQIPLPPLSEQAQMVRFLDWKVGEIQRLSAIRKKQIRLWQALKKSIINRAFLNSTSAKKHRLKFIAKSNQQSLNEFTPSDYTFRYVDISSVDSIKGITHYETTTFENAPSRARRIVKKNDIIVSTVRTYLRANARIIDDDDVIVSTGFSVITPLNADSHYLEYYFKTDMFCDEVSRRSIGIAYPAINNSTLMDIFIPVPPLSEQQAIAAYLDGQCGKIDAACATLKAQIAALDALKTRLIADVVSGHIDVRHIPVPDHAADFAPDFSADDGENGDFNTDEDDDKEENSESGDFG